MRKRESGIAPTVAEGDIQISIVGEGGKPQQSHSWWCAVDRNSTAVRRRSLRRPAVPSIHHRGSQAFGQRNDTPAGTPVPRGHSPWHTIHPWLVGSPLRPPWHLTSPPYTLISEQRVSEIKPTFILSCMKLFGNFYMMTR